jgi:hypothetical protein
MTGSLSQAIGFRAGDALAALPGVAYKPENVVLGSYTFVSWVRSGLSAAIRSPQPGEVRGTVQVRVTVSEDGGQDLPLSRTFSVRGPGDVVAVDPTQIIRRVPAAGARDAESNVLVHIEFDQPEFPWLFSPFAPNAQRAEPWLALVVCDTAYGVLEPGRNGALTRLRCRMGELQPLDDNWAWAHAQVSGHETANAGEPSLADRLGAAHAPQNCSRVLCPRRLDDGRHYVAALVPAFDAGVQAGLGLEGGTLAPAWQRAADGSDADQEVTLPVYAHWTFATGPAGDFESLARRIVPVAAPWTIGRRVVDVSQPMGGLPPLPAEDVGSRLVLRGALVSPAAMPEGQPSESDDWPVTQREALCEALNRVQASDDDLPRVGARLYARFQAARARVDLPTTADGEPDPATDWFAHLNTSPLMRIVAGLGTRVVRKDQEPLMQAAWAQVGEIQRVNQSLALAQFGRFVSESLHRTHLSRLDLGAVAQVTRPVHGKLKPLNQPATVAGQLAVSFTPPAALSPAFRRATRPRGPFKRFTAANRGLALRTLVAEGGTLRDWRIDARELEGVRTLSSRALETLDVQRVARKLQVPLEQALPTLQTRLRPLRDRPTVAELAARPLAQWAVPAGRFDLSQEILPQVTQRIEALNAGATVMSSARDESVAGLLAGITQAAPQGPAGRFSQQLEVIHGRLPWSPGGLTGAAGLQVGSATVAAGQGPAVPLLRSGAVTRLNRPVGTGFGNLPPAAQGGTGSVFKPADVVRPGVVIPNAGGPIVTTPTGPTRPIELPNVVVPPQPGQTGRPVEPGSPQLRFETEASRRLADVLRTGRDVPARDVAAALSQLIQDSSVNVLAPTPSRQAAAVTRQQLLDSLRPGLTLSAQVRSRLGELPSWLPRDWFRDERIQPIMAAPRFDRPMAEALADYDRDWLIPGLGEIELPDFMTLLESNAVFTEAFMLGLSDEMGRELLWRGYPTDQRGTCFWRFWQGESDELTGPIHRFARRSALGSHVRVGSAGQNLMVLVIRGELFRRYPDAWIVAARAGPRGAQQPPQFQDPSEPGSYARVVFQLPVQPDYLLVGLDLTKAQVTSEDWWFLLCEHPTAPRFGLDIVPPGNARAAGLTPREALDWNDLTDGIPGSGRLRLGRFLSPQLRSLKVTDPRSTPATFDWNASSGSIARTLLQNPVRAAFHARRMLSPTA